MKRSILTLAVILAASILSFSQKAPDAPELTRMLNEFLAGAGGSDPAVHDRFWADDVIYTRSAGVRTTKAEIMKGLSSAAAPKSGDPVTVYTAEDVLIRQYGDMAIVAFRLVSNTTRADGTRTVGNNLNTGVFLKRKGKWQVVAWQSTIVPKPETKGQTAVETKSEKTPTGLPLVTSRDTVASVPASGTRVYQKGPRGGCYYLGSSGKKVYVDHKFCN